MEQKTPDVIDAEFVIVKRKPIRWRLPLAAAGVAATTFAVSYAAGWVTEPPTWVTVPFAIGLYALAWPANRALYKALTGRVSEAEVAQLRSRARASWGRAGGAADEAERS